mmetsp:Transcript_39021/g.76757  ORF Transcript_39021/g.76757 Transcript_39021/m.76757 type:complete len:96 (+) Transcript_39021:394-681(+)
MYLCLSRHHRFSFLSSPIPSLFASPSFLCSTTVRSASRKERRQMEKRKKKRERSVEGAGVVVGECERTKKNWKGKKRHGAFLAACLPTYLHAFSH